MNEIPVAQRLLLWVLRLVLVAVGAVLALFVLCGIALLLMVWSVKRLWARLTGRPVAPWVLRTDPLAVWRQTAAFGQRRPAPAPDGRRGGDDDGIVPPSRVAVGDVTDVTPK